MRQWSTASVIASWFFLLMNCVCVCGIERTEEYLAQSLLAFLLELNFSISTLTMTAPWDVIARASKNSTAFPDIIVIVVTITVMMHDNNYIIDCQMEMNKLSLISPGKCPFFMLSSSLLLYKIIYHVEGWLCVQFTEIIIYPYHIWQSHLNCVFITQFTC